MELGRINPIAQNTAIPAAQIAAGAGRHILQEAAPPPVNNNEQISSSLAKAVLKDSGIKPADISRFNVRLDIHKETGRVVANIFNKETGKLVQKVPSEALLRQAEMLGEVLGTILDSKT